MIPTRKRIMGSQTGSIQDVEDTLAIAARHRIKPMLETLPLERAQEALEQVRRGTPRFKVVLDITQNETS